MSKHGIVVRNTQTKEIVEFIECSGRQALSVLSGIRHNLNKDDFNACEDIISDADYLKFKEASQ